MEQKDRSELSYWYNEDNILTMPCVVPPTVGEIVHIDTKMNPDWYDARWDDRKFFREGVCGYFKVKSVKRFYRSYDITAKDELGGKEYVFPGQRHVEIFEIQLEALTKEEEKKQFES
jgi:hypothetical protein